jgi:hypothetical protein
LEHRSNAMKGTRIAERNSGDGRYSPPTNLDEFRNRGIKEFAIRQCMKERAGIAAFTRA